MKLFLIDGHALIFKMYYAFLGRPMINGKGQDTSILFGFTKYLLELLEREKPTHVAVSFDPPGGTFRNRMYPQYKANRAETPQLVIDALEPLTQLVKAMNIPVLMVPGFEADDVIGSMAKRSAAEGAEVYMVTPDKDYGQIVGTGIFQYRPGKSGAENEILGPDEICSRWNISDTSQVIDILAICGDSADNVPGVQGVGPVGAAKLLARYGSVEGIYSHLDDLTSRQQELFRAAQDHIELSRELVTIRTDIPLETTMDDMALSVSVTDELLSLFDRFEFPSLKRKLSQISSMAPAAVQQISKKHAVRPENCRRVSPSGLSCHKVALYLKDSILWAASDGLISSGRPMEFRSLLEDECVSKAGCDLKTLLKRLQQDGIVLRGHLEDVSLMHYLLDPEHSHTLDSLALKYLDEDIGDVPPEDVSTGSLFDDDLIAPSREYFREAICIHELSGILSRKMEEEGMQKLYSDMEEPLLRVLASMEMDGVRIDPAALSDFADSLREQMASSEQRVRELAGEPQLNISSPKQLGVVLFEKMKLDPKAKKPRSGSWPTDETTLLELSDRSPIIDAILEYRGTRKLLSTYIDPLPGSISKLDGRVHTTFNQTLTSTGRLSSSNPNLQNIPVRTEQGREIRKAFVPDGEDSVIMSADYSQIELRIMAHLCGDEHLCRAFREGVDVHSATASKIFGVPSEEVNPDMRRVAKTANFGIMYGISAFGLSQRLGCSRSEASKIIEDYFSSFPSIRSFIDKTLSDARSNGYVRTLFGRRRYVPDITSSNGNLRSLAERNAVNAPIQGTAADIIKLAMTGVDRSLREGGFQARMVLQIHDELLLEVPREEISAVRELLIRQMERVTELSVPLTVECNYGKNWLEAH